MAESLKIVVMLGGPSLEREVSLRSGAAVAEALRGCGHRVELFDPSGSPEAWGFAEKPDVVFLALHGTYGEDGTVQARLDALGIPYTGCGAVASRVAFDKVLTKKRCEQAGLMTARYGVITSPHCPWPPGWGPPAVLKPVRQGSSVGLRFVETRDAWPEAVTAAFAYDREILLEEKIVGREMTVGILADEALPIVEIRPRQGAYDYHNKYTVGATEYLCPAPIPPALTTRVQQAALTAFRVIGGRDYGRIDIILTEAGIPFILEVNTLPGMTETSLLPKAAAAAGLSYAGLCQKMVDLAMRRFAPSVS